MNSMEHKTSVFCRIHVQVFHLRRPIQRRLCLIKTGISWEIWWGRRGRGAATSPSPSMGVVSVYIFCKDDISLVS
jgi:hypothetical protein